MKKQGAAVRLQTTASGQETNSDSDSDPSSDSTSPEAEPACGQATAPAAGTASGQATAPAPAGKRARLTETEYQELRREIEEAKTKIFEKDSSEDLYQAVCEERVEQALQMMENVPVSRIRYKDVGGMTLLHRAAMMASLPLVERLLAEAPDLASCPTYRTRSPGNWTPLMCLAEADHTKMRMDDVRSVTRLLAECMTITALGQDNTKGNTVLHLAANRGNFDFLNDCCCQSWLRGALARITN